jgi:hypothetical protein
VEVELSKGLTGDLEPLLGIQTPVRAPETARFGRKPRRHMGFCQSDLAQHVP